MSWTRFVSGASPYVGVVISPLTSVAKAIYELQAIQDLRQGLGQLFRVPRFLNHAKQTRGLLEQSALSNIVKYALPIMMYRRAIDLSLKVFPDSIDPVINALDWCITITIFARLYLLKATDNTVYLFSLPRVIANDVTRQLPIDLSRLLSQELARILKGSILRNGQSETDLRVELSADLLPVFVKFISKNEFSALSFASLQQELNDVFIRLINRQDDLAILPDFIDKFSALLAKSMADTLAMPFQLTKNETHAQTQRDFCKLLKTIFRTEESERITAFLFDKLDQVTREVQSSFPIKHHGPCGCGTLRLMRASLSTPLCHLGNVIIASSPGLLYQRGWVLPDVYKILKVSAYLMKLVIYGQSFDAEYKTAGHCTRHRYRVFSRNKAYSMGVGISYVLSSELLAMAFYQLTGVDNFFTRDALGAMVMQLIVTATLAYREPLPGKRENTWDLFNLPRYTTMTVAKKVHELFLPDLNRPESREKCYQYAKKKISSPYVMWVAKWFFSQPDFLPRYHQDVIQQDLIALLLKRRSVKTFLDVYMSDIQEMLPKITRAHELSCWVKGPLLVIPPSWISSFVVFPILFLREDALKQFIDEFYLHMIAICQTRIVPYAVRTNVPRVIMEPAPTLVETVPVEHSLVSKKNAVEMALAEALGTELVVQPTWPLLEVGHMDEHEFERSVEPESDLDSEDDAIYQSVRTRPFELRVTQSVHLTGIQQTMWKQVKGVVNKALIADGRRVDRHQQEIELKTF